MPSCFTMMVQFAALSTLTFESMRRDPPLAAAPIPGGTTPTMTRHNNLAVVELVQRPQIEDGLGRTGNGQPELLVEIAVVDLARPPDAHGGATHQPLRGSGD